MLLKRMAHHKIQILLKVYTRSQTIQDVDEFVSSSDLEKSSIASVTPLHIVWVTN